MDAIAIVVFWCVTSAPFDNFNAHQLSAVQKFIVANPATCGASAPVMVDGPKTIAECRRDALLRYGPGWQMQNPGKVYMMADCFERRWEKLDLEAFKLKVTP